MVKTVEEFYLYLQLFPIALQPQLVKYLLKSLGTDVCNEIFTYVANECGLSFDGDITAEQRLRIQQECGKYMNCLDFDQS